MNRPQTERLEDMLRWLLENPAVVEIICGLDSPTAQDMAEILDRLAKQGYFEFILLLLTRFHDDRDVSRALADYLAERLSFFLRENGPCGELSVFQSILAGHLAQNNPAEG